MFIFLDTETTGTGPNDRLCQIAFKPDNGPIATGLFNPGKPISVDAMVVHHITNKMVHSHRRTRGLWPHLVYGRDAGKDVGSDRRQVTGRVRGELVFRVFIKDGRCPEHQGPELKIGD